jgi:predicted nuclease of predicted toxin-antitoxin system
LLDESAEARIAAFLANLGHDARRIGSDYPAGIPDRQVLAIARDERRILVTNDRDFGELIFEQRRPHAGVIFLRFPLDATANQKIDALARLLETHPDRLDRFLVVSPRGVRVR